MGIIERYIIFGLVASLLFGGAYFYISWQNKEIQFLIKDNAILKDVAEENETTIVYLKKQVDIQSEENKKLTAAIQKSERIREDMLRIFMEHDLTKLATSKPGMIEKRINDGTEKAFKDLESITSGN